jgi:ABC-type spermidine/putrescine transport system permease subunit II
MSTAAPAPGRAAAPSGLTRWLRGRRGGTWGDRALAVVALLVFVFLFAPIVTAIVFSFNEGVAGRQTSTFTGFTASAYADVWKNEAIRSALTTSLKAGVVVAIIAPILGTIAGLTLARGRSRVIRVATGVLVTLLLVIPEIVLAVALLLFFSESQTTLGMSTLVAGLLPYPIAIVALIVRSRAVALDRSTDEAAADLGARDLQRVRDVLLPQLRPAIVAGAILSFTFTFDNLIISSMLATPTTTTLPTFLFATVNKGGVTSAGYAIAAMMLAFTLVMLALAGLAYRWEMRRQGASAGFVQSIGGS